MLDAQPTAARQHAEVVAVGSETGFHCSGVMIAPRLVLTARHCLPAARVLFGSAVAQPQQIITVEQDETAPAGLDAALLVLAAAVPYTPARVDLHKAPPAPRGLLRMVGFGATEPTGRRGFGQKRFADVPAEGWGCSPARSQILGCAPATDLVLFNFGRKDTCDGDSGGPVFATDEGGSRLIAITSRAVRSSRERCGRGGIYLRIDALASWLSDRLGSGSVEVPAKERP